MKFIDTLKNIWSIAELKDKILFTLLILAIYRFGSFVTLPGVVPRILESSAGSGEGILGLINSFTGGAFNQGSVFALGIMPYITASIIIQLLGFAVPYFQRLQSREGESGRKKITQITRLLTVFITLVQGGGYLAYIKSMGAISPNVSESAFWLSNIIILSTGTIFAMWLGEKITDKGIGNGISLLIMIGIIATLPFSFFAEVKTQLTVAQWAMKDGSEPSAFLMALQDWKSPAYNVIFFILVVVFTYVYTALIVNPQQYAEHLKRQNSFIPGIKPGTDTQEYIDSLTTRVTLPGSIFLGLIAILPGLIANMGVNDGFALFFGGTSLLILVAVVLDTLQQIESYLLMRKYDGLTKTGKLKGRGGNGMQIGASM